ncbi:acyl-coenzyme A diphosphatase FITM2 [Gastrophryne carolinensis]
MEPLERCASLFQHWLFGERARRFMAPALVLLALAGSAVKEFSPLPDSYFSSKRNLLNVYFVKLSWGWTLFLLLPFVGLSSYVATRSISGTFRRMSALLVGTAVWYGCTGFFAYVENLTGACYFAEDTPAEAMAEVTDRRSCARSGGSWDGFDISGHSFLLPYCVLMILEEAAILDNDKLQRSAARAAVHALVVALGLLALVWIVMFSSTALYFHTPPQKVCGTAFAIAAWYATYRCWYHMTLSPGLPPRFPAKRSARKTH